MPSNYDIWNDKIIYWGLSYVSVGRYEADWQVEISENTCNSLFVGIL